MEDFTNRRFGHLLVLQDIHKGHGKGTSMCRCMCDCGAQIMIPHAEMHNRTSCGCSRINRFAKPVNSIQQVVDKPKREYKHSSAGYPSDITGMKFGRLTAIEKLPEKGSKWLCRCDCGTELVVARVRLVSGNTQSCGCIHSPSLIGKKFGRLTVISQAQRPEGSNQRWWNCLCDCGQMTVVRSHTLTSGHTASCGCLFSEGTSKGQTLIAQILNEYKAEYIKQMKFDGCIGIGGHRLRFDFYIPRINTVIEYDGQQHFIPADYFGGEESYNRQKQNDEIKNKYCEENGINLVRLPYTLSNEKIIKSVVDLLNV